MIRQLFLLLLVTIPIFCFGQKNFTSIDEKSKTVPNSIITYFEIAHYLTKDLIAKEDKARALYVWISHNIKYDLNQVNANKRYESEQEIINEVLHDRKGLCQHYAELFHAMSQSVGLQTYVIDGYTRDVFNNIATSSHAWNAIRIDSKYYLIEMTWAAGYTLNGKYVHEFTDNHFMISPQVFILDHMPFDPIWQFLDNPLTNKAFTVNDMSNLNTAGNFPFNELIQQYTTLDELGKLETSSQRIQTNGITNSMIQQQLHENIYQVNILKFNLAINTLNDGITKYNEYVAAKNTQFNQHQLSDTQIRDLINNPNIALYTAKDMLQKITTSNKDLTNMIRQTLKRMPEVLSNLEKEKTFVDRYLSKSKAQRISMFYTS